LPGEFIGAPEAGWTEINPFADVEGPASFVSGEADSRLLRVKYFLRERDNAIVGKVWFGPRAGGPASHIHGGAIAAVMDEAVGAAAYHAGHTILLIRLNVNFRMMAPSMKEVMLETEIRKVHGRKVFVFARLHDEKGVSIAEAEGFGVKVPMEKLALERNKARS